MATERLQYYIPSSGGGLNNGRQVDVTFTYDENAPLNSDGTVTVTGVVKGTYEVISDTGDIIRTDQITGLAPPDAASGNDNHLRIGSEPYVNNNGISYVVSNFYDTDSGSGYVNFFYGNTGHYFEGGPNANYARVIESAPCFTTGTLIRLSIGNAAVENLRVGDLAVTASGALRPITWIGHRVLCGRDRPLPHDQQPVRIRAGAFGPDLPARDLCLSPGHPVLVGADADLEGGYLVPIMSLINGTTIARVPVETVTYWHVELDGHDILLAEGLPAESYLDWGDRPFFTEAADHALANPDFVVPGLAGRCRPVALDGPVVEAERRRLDAVLAARLAGAAAWPSVQNALLALF